MNSDGARMTNREWQKQSIIKMLDLANEEKIQLIYFFVLHLI